MSMRCSIATNARACRPARLLVYPLRDMMEDLACFRVPFAAEVRAAVAAPPPLGAVSH
jgi:hypothetical protein